MGIQILVSFLLTISIVASGLLIANAEKMISSTKSPAEPAKESKTIEKDFVKQKKEEFSQAGQKEAETNLNKSHALPIIMELSSPKNMYKSREDFMVKAELWALQPVTICFYPEHPEANFSVDIYRAGYGKLDIPPNVIQLSNKDLFNTERIQLVAGQMHRIVFNVKKLVTMPPSFWKTGEYRMQMKFFLCGKTEQSEIAIPSNGVLHLLVLD